MNRLVTKGIVLTRTKFGEADRIITVLTSDRGKVRLMAKGVRKIKSKMAGGIELFCISDISYIAGKGNIGTLVSSRPITSFSQIVKDLNRTNYAYDILKIVNKITEDSAGSDYFELLARTLSALNQPEVKLDLIRLWTNLQLMELGGHSPNLETDPTGQKLDAASKFSFSFDDMAFSPNNVGPYDARAVKFLRLARRAGQPAQLQKINDVAELWAPLGQLTRSMFAQYSSASDIIISND